MNESSKIAEKTNRGTTRHTTCARWVQERKSGVGRRVRRSSYRKVCTQWLCCRYWSTGCTDWQMAAGDCLYCDCSHSRDSFERIPWFFPWATTAVESSPSRKRRSLRRGGRCYHLTPFPESSVGSYPTMTASSSTPSHCPHSPSYPYPSDYRNHPNKHSRMHCKQVRRRLANNERKLASSPYSNAVWFYQRSEMV